MSLWLSLNYYYLAFTLLSMNLTRLTQIDLWILESKIREINKKIYRSV